LAKFKVWNKVAEGNTLIFEIPEFPYNALKDKPSRE